MGEYRSSSLQLHPSLWTSQMKLKIPSSTGEPKPWEKAVTKSKECAPSRFFKVKVMEKNYWKMQTWRSRSERSYTKAWLTQQKFPGIRQPQRGHWRSKSASCLIWRTTQSGKGEFIEDLLRIPSSDKTHLNSMWLHSHMYQHFKVTSSLKADFTSKNIFHLSGNSWISM